MGRHLVLLAAAGLVLVAASGSARADEPSPRDKSLAQSLFDEARSLMDQGKYADACPRFADSERLDPGGGTLLNLALCYEKLGQLALAYATYNEAISAAIAERRHEREVFARDRAAALSPRLPRLTLTVTDAPPGMQVLLDHANVPPSTWGTPMAVDPGAHTLEATAPTRSAWKTDVSVSEGEARQIVITLAPAPTPPQPPALAPQPAAPQPAAPPPPATHVERTRSTAFYVLGGVTLAALAVSAVTGGMAWSAHESVGQKCSLLTGYCSDPTGIDDAAQARNLAWISTATMGAGVILGIVTLALPLDRRITLDAVPAGAGLSLQGRWQ